MNKYKVKIVQGEAYIIDVLAKNEQEAQDKATTKWNEVCENGTYHYHQDGETSTNIDYVYDITNTDDPFNP